MPLNRITLVVQPIPNLLNFAFLAALIAFAECLLPLLDSSNFPVFCRNISLHNPHYVPHLLCSSTRNHQLLKCNPICLSQILPKIQPLKTKKSEGDEKQRIPQPQKIGGFQHVLYSTTEMKRYSKGVWEELLCSEILRT